MSIVEKFLIHHWVGNILRIMAVLKTLEKIFHCQITIWLHTSDFESH